ncbi:MAG TPA: ATP-binding protein, partial [Candidatus Megaira endosymbiont of Hartmannula sinica]|nr:ATP-binding protein [Candidatus Megaera endosymbiont of Hartmannula sinica]
MLEKIPALFIHNLQSAITKVEKVNKIAIAVSGGVDSMVMAHIAHKYLLNNNINMPDVNLDLSSHISDNIKLYIFHFNHGLRDESNLEEDCVRRYSKKIKSCYIFSKWKNSDRNLSSIQTSARNA